MTRGWRAVAATHIGSSHERLGLSNQDAHAVVERPGAMAVAVADGHGAPAHFRSEHGARIAADVTAHMLAEAAAKTVGHEDLLAAGRNVVGPDLVDRWRRDVLAHASTHERSDREPVTFDAANEAAVIRAYGTTVIGLVVTPAAVGLVQIGDGDAVVVAGDDVVRPLPPDPDLVGSVTTSLCQPDPLRSLRVGAINRADTDVVLAWASTDGFGAPRTNESGWWREIGVELAQHLRTRGADWIEERLSEWLDEPATVGGDDTTVGLLLNLSYAGVVDGAVDITSPGSSSA